MSDTREPIGYQPCTECKELRAIYQGRGKRARFLQYRCGCGFIQPTGGAIMDKLAKFTSKEEAQEQLDKILASESNQQPSPKKTESTNDDEKPSKIKAPVIIAVLGVLGFLTLRR